MANFKYEVGENVSVKTTISARASEFVIKQLIIVGTMKYAGDNWYLFVYNTSWHDQKLTQKFIDETFAISSYKELEFIGNITEYYGNKCYWYMEHDIISKE